MTYGNNFNLTKEAQEFVGKLIREAQEKRHLIGGVICKSNIKLNDNLDVIKENSK